MQSIGNNSHLPPYVQLLWSALLDWEERICLLISLFQISGEIPNTTNHRNTQPKQSLLGYIFWMGHMGTIIYEQ
jgi:hypothetical protein